MIKANEVRIGNLVNKCHVDYGWATTKIEIYDIENMLETDGLSSYEPIPLTEEWLVKFRFEDLIKGTYICKHQVVLKKESDGYSYEKFSHQKIIIKSVHQIQNLYFALTGEELVIK